MFKFSFCPDRLFFIKFSLQVLTYLLESFQKCYEHESPVPTDWSDFILNFNSFQLRSESMFRNFYYLFQYRPISWVHVEFIFPFRCNIFPSECNYSRTEVTICKSMLIAVCVWYADSVKILNFIQKTSG